MIDGPFTIAITVPFTIEGSPYYHGASATIELPNGMIPSQADIQAALEAAASKIKEMSFIPDGCRIYFLTPEEFGEKNNEEPKPFTLDIHSGAL